jgi:hypothetical protein
MKRIAYVLIFAVATFGATNSSAQTLEGLFDSLSKMLSSSESAETQAEAKVEYPTEKEITGKWTYQEMVMESTGSSTLATLAVSSAATQLPALATKMGITGKEYVRIKGDGTMLFVGGDSKIEAKYTYVKPTGKIIVSVVHKGQTITLTGSVAKVNGGLKVLFNAKEVAAKAELVSSKFKDNSTFAILKELINSYPGIMGGAIFKK